MIQIRQEQPEDVPAIQEVESLAFGQPDEARLVERLRKNSQGTLSLVAVRDGRIVGHILFSSVTIDGEGSSAAGMGLGPLAVLPEVQRQGIGSALAREGIRILESQGCPFIVVLGHARYYPRFGFETASRYGLRCTWSVPGDNFMILVLDDSSLSNLRGEARYRPEFYAEG
jgi:putative acetyltransferase